jgi:hypothetical protein
MLHDPTLGKHDGDGAYADEHHRGRAEKLRQILGQVRFHWASEGRKHVFFERSGAACLIPIGVALDTYALEETPEALVMMASRKVQGKIVLKIS